MGLWLRMLADRSDPQNAHTGSPPSQRTAVNHSSAASSLGNISINPITLMPLRKCLPGAFCAIVALIRLSYVFIIRKLATLSRGLASLEGGANLW